MSSELANALGNPVPLPRTEDSNYDDTLELKHDPDAEDVKPPTENEDVHGSHGEEEMEDLFGDDKDAEEVRHDGTTTPASSEHADGISSPERRHREALEYAEEDEPDQTIEEEVLEAVAQIPNIPVPRNSDGNHWVFRIPNFVRVDSKPFHPETYVGPEHEDDEGHSESVRDRGMSIKLKVENTLRWRWTKDEDGQDRRQSNSRIIRWSDGSLSLKLGKELFDVTQTIDTSGAVPRQAIGGSQGSQQALRTAPPATKAQGLTYLVAQHKRAEILQCEAMITGTMTLRPTGMQSEAHRMLARAVGQKHTKQARLRLAPDPMIDPEREKMELLKQVSKKTRKPRGEDDGLGGGRRRRSGYSRKRSGDDMWSDDEDEEAFGGASDDEFGQAGPSGRHAKRRKTGDADAKRGPGEYQNDDFVVADSDEDADYDDGKGRRQKKRKAGYAGEEDDLDRLDAKIEAEERKRKQQEKPDDPAAADASAKGAEEEEAMEVESEEDEEWGVRRPTKGSRKKLAIEFDDDEED